MKTFKTKAGTELPLLNLKGKDYLQVAHRLIWFREEKPDWSIETEVKSDDHSAIAKATIKDEQGRIRATAHKTENIKGFPDFVEKAETGSVGRALALISYGTQFAPELDEGERIVDAPIEPTAPKAVIKPVPVVETILTQGNPIKQPPQCSCGAQMRNGQYGLWCPQKKAKPKVSHVPQPVNFDDGDVGL